MRSDQNDILGQMLKKLTLTKCCRSERNRVLMDWVSGAEQGVSNNKMYLELNGFQDEKGVLKYNKIDKYWTQINNDGWNIINVD